MAGEPVPSLHGQTVPVLLLKTKSSPTDAYEDLFSTPHDDFRFEPTFVPVLQHCFEEDGLKSVRKLLHERKINNGVDSAYGGLIFTSQRAVEAFAKLVDEGQGLLPACRPDYRDYCHRCRCRRRRHRPPLRHRYTHCYRTTLSLAYHLPLRRLRRIFTPRVRLHLRQ